MVRNLIFTFLILFSSQVLADDFTEKITFSKPYDCEAHYTPITRCIVTRPKEFSDGEKKVILESLQKLNLAAGSLFKKIFDKTQTIELYRHTNAAQRVSNKTFKKNLTTIAWVDLRSKNKMHITDRFFSIQKNINNEYTFQDYLLLHELSHIFDNNMKSLSQTEEFLSLYEWEETPTGESFFVSGVEIKKTRWQPLQASYLEIDKIREEANALFAGGQGEKATQLSLDFGQSHGHPTSYSMTNPFENFAEIITHYFIDPQSMRTVPTSVIDWLDHTFGN